MLRPCGLLCNFVIPQGSFGTCTAECVYNASLGQRIPAFNVIASDFSKCRKHVLSLYAEAESMHSQVHCQWPAQPAALEHCQWSMPSSTVPIPACSWS